MKRNKKGFSLFEILVVVLIISIAGISSMLVLSNSINASKESDKQEIIERIERAAQIYIDLNEEASQELYEENELYVRLGVLQDLNYLPYGLTDPVTNDKFPSGSYVHIYINTNDEIKYDYVE